MESTLTKRMGDDKTQFTELNTSIATQNRLIPLLKGFFLAVKTNVIIRS